MGDFIEPETHRSTNIKVKIETLQKKSEIYFSYCIESNDFIYMRFLTAQLNITLMKKNHEHEGYTKMHKISGNLTFQS